MKLSEDLVWRQLIKDKTFGEVEWLDKPRVFYHGVDASASSLTVGNLAAMLLARRLAEAGWQAVLLAGGATSLIGDPGGKTAERELLPREQVQTNVEAIKKQISGLFAGQKFKLVDNYDWLAGVKYLDFLREVGKEFSMSELMQREFVTERMGAGGNGISYAEFSYSLVQGYDFWQLYKTEQTELQLGGSDQWGNMLSGVALIRKKEGKEVHALSMPLVVNKDTGQKFGKSEAGAIWLDPEKTTPSDFYQFWINTSDTDVEEYLKVFTFLNRPEIEEIMDLQQKDPSKRSAQKRLADEVTALVHGEGEKIKAGQHAQSLKSSANNLPPHKLKSGVSLVEALVQSGLATSNSEARRVIDEGGVYADNKAFKEEFLTASDFKGGRLILRRGKKLQNSALIELE